MHLPIGDLMTLLRNIQANPSIFKLNIIQNNDFKIYVVVQMIGIMFISNALFSQISTLSYQEIAVVSIILTLIPTLTGIYMQDNANALLAISIFSLTCIGLILWSNLFPVNSLLPNCIDPYAYQLKFCVYSLYHGSYVGPENIQQKV